MRIQFLFENNPTPLILEMDQERYTEIVTALRAKNVSPYIVGDLGDNVPTFFLRTEKLLSAHVIEDEEFEEIEEEGDKLVFEPVTPAVDLESLLGKNEDKEK